MKDGQNPIWMMHTLGFQLFLWFHNHGMGVDVPPRRYMGVLEFMRTGGYSYKPPRMPKIPRPDFDDIFHQRALEKERLIAEALRWSQTRDFKSGHAEMMRLMSEWKRVGSAGRDRENDLWSRFNEARDTFYSRRKADRIEKQQKQSRNLSAKQNIVNRLEQLLPRNDCQNLLKEMRFLFDEFYKLGFCGPEEGRLLREVKRIKSEIRQKCSKKDKNAFAMIQERGLDVERKVITVSSRGRDGKIFVREQDGRELGHITLHNDGTIHRHGVFSSPDGKNFIHPDGTRRKKGRRKR